MAETHLPDAKAAGRNERVVPARPPCPDGQELTDEQLDKVAGGFGNAHEMKKALIGNLPK
jgi:hypothetical protein